MGYMTINNRRVTFDQEKNVLSVIRKSGIDLPTFCYHSELSTYGACRMCVVEDDRGKVFASCSEKPRDGMVIYTNTPRITAPSENDSGALIGIPQPGLYDLPEEWNLYLAETFRPVGCELCPV